MIVDDKELDVKETFYVLMSNVINFNFCVPNYERALINIDLNNKDEMALINGDLVKAPVSKMEEIKDYS